MTACYNENDPFAAQWLRNLIDAGLIAPGDVDERSITDVKADDLAGYGQCHFFAGIGGWSRALRLAGWEDNRPVWTGSCPCQPFSCAGKQRGTKDERHLWPEFARLIGECKPETIFGEQVASAEVVGAKLEAAFIVAVQSGKYAGANKIAKQLAGKKGFGYGRRWIDGVRADMEKIGYAFGIRVLGAHSAGAPHIRQRLFWVADMPGERREEGWTMRRRPKERIAGSCHFGGVADLPGDRRIGEAATAEDEKGRQPRPIGTGELSGRPEGCATPLGGVVDSVNPRPQRLAGDGDGSNQSRRDETDTDGSITAPGFWGDFDLVSCREDKTRRVESCSTPLAHGIPRSMGQPKSELRAMAKSAKNNRKGRLKGYGNAIVPQVAAMFIESFMEAL